MPNRACGGNFLPLLLPAPGQLGNRPRGIASGNWPPGIGVSNRALHETVAFARLPSDRKRVLHEPDAAGVFPAEVARVESRVAEGVERDPESSPGREPLGTGHRRPRLTGDR